MLDDDDKKWISALVAKAVAESEARTAERIERVETNLLTAFHQWASPNEARQRTHREAIYALELEVEQLKERVAKLEPPASIS